MDILVISKNDNKNNWIDSKDIDNNINVNFYFIESFDDLNKIKTIDLMNHHLLFMEVIIVLLIYTIFLIFIFVTISVKIIKSTKY